MDDKTEEIYRALNGLCKALDLRGESGTEKCFIILSSVFDDENFQELEAIRKESHDEGLMYNMLWPIASKIKSVSDDFEASDVPPWNRG